MGIMNNVTSDKASVAVTNVKKRITNFLMRKEKGINGVVIEVGLIVVGVVLLFVFRDQITVFVQELIKGCLDSVKGMFNLT